MSNPFSPDSTPRMLPKQAKVKTALTIVSPLVKLDIIKEGEGLTCRNANKLDLTDSIYEKIDED